MKKITMKGIRGISPHKERAKLSRDKDLPPPLPGSESQKQDLPSPCAHNSSLCNACFKTEQCACCLSLQSENTLENGDTKRKTKGGLFNTIRRKFTSPKHRDSWDCSSTLNSEVHGCFHNSNEMVAGCLRKAPYRSRSAERPCRSRNSDEHNNRPAGSRSVQLHKKHLSLSTATNTSNRRHSYKQHRREQRSEDSEDSQIDEGRPKDVLPFDGYGHASPFSNELSVFEGTLTNRSRQQANESRVHRELESDTDGTTMTVPVMMPFYDQVKDPLKEPWSLTKELLKLSKQGWYWGPINRMEAESKLSHQPDGAFLVRDSSDEHYLLSLSFRSFGRTLHTRIEHCNGVFSFYAQPESEGFCSIVELIEHSMSDSQTGVFCYSRARTPGSPSFPVRLTRPVSRFTQVRSLQYLCRFVIRQTTRVDHIQKLPLPSSIKGWLQQNQY